MMHDYFLYGSETGWFFFECSLRNVLLIGTVGLFLRWMRFLSSSWRHAVWATTIAAAIFMPIFVSVLPGWHVLPTINSETVSKSSSDINDVQSSDINTAPSKTKSQLERSLANEAFPQVADEFVSFAASDLETISRINESSRFVSRVLLFIWGLGVAVFLSPALVSFVILFGLTKRFETAVDGRLKARLSELCSRLEINEPRVILGSSDQMPLVWQFRHPYLLLPRTCTTWSDERVHSVLLHELAHLSRRDPITMLMGQTCRALHWFNPMIWYAVAQMRCEQESACDDFVLRSGLHADSYATHLLELSIQLQSKIIYGSVALSMATKSKIESRLRQILDPNLNRESLRGTGYLSSISAALLLAFVFCSIGFRAEGSIAEELDPELKWPNCELNLKVLPYRTLEVAVSQFNEDSKTSPIGHSQPPLTVEDLENRIKSLVAEPDAPTELKSRLSGVLESGKLPPDVYLRRFTRFDDGKQMHGVWWIRLVWGLSNHKKNAVTIRASHLYSRPYTLLEREQNADKSLTLLNRLSSYYESLPERIDTTIAEQPAIGFANKVQKLLVDKDKDQLLKLFNWNKVSSKTKKFAISEFDELTGATIESVKFVPLALQGNLVTWQAFHCYKPNLPIIGHLRVIYRDGKSNVSQTKHLEVGRNKRGQYFFVGYVVDRRMPIPKEIKPPMSISSQMFARKELQPVESEFHSENSYYLTWQIENPAKLLSAHLANEEIWLRSSEPDVARLAVDSTELVLGKSDDRELKNVVWGKPFNGLKAAVVLENNDDAKAFDLSYYVMNVSDQEIRFDSETWRQNDRFHVWTADGERREIGTQSTWYSGWPVIRTHILLPGQFTKLSSGKLNYGLGAESKRDIKAEPYGIDTKPGKYLVQFVLNIPGFAMENDHWKGELKTGLTPFEIE